MYASSAERGLAKRPSVGTSRQTVVSSQRIIRGAAGIGDGTPPQRDERPGNTGPHGVRFHVTVCDFGCIRKVNKYKTNNNKMNKLVLFDPPVGRWWWRWWGPAGLVGRLMCASTG